MMCWRGFDISKKLTTAIRTKVSACYGKVKQSAWQTSSSHRVHDIFIKLEFKISKKDIKNNGKIGTDY